MKWLMLLLLALGAGCASLTDEATPGTRAALAPGGVLRVGLYSGNPLSAIRDGDRTRGVGFELGSELARRLGARFEPVIYPSVGALFEGAKSRQWDVAFFIMTPARAREYDFAGPLLRIELGYLVAAHAALRAASEVDRAGVRVATVDKGQGDVILSKTLKHATLVRTPGLPALAEQLRNGQADALAANKTTLLELAGQLPGSRLLEGSFATEAFGMALPQGRDAGLPYARAFIRDLRRSGRAKAAMENAGARGAVVATDEN